MKYQDDITINFFILIFKTSLLTSMYEHKVYLTTPVDKKGPCPERVCCVFVKPVTHDARIHRHRIRLDCWIPKESVTGFYQTNLRDSGSYWFLLFGTV